MQQEDFFKNAKWIGAAERTEKTFSTIRAIFDLDNVKKACIRVLGLGFFKCYINGKCINSDTFLPLSADYEDSCDPKDEVLSNHRIYVPEFDITPFVKTGRNTIAICFGGGWYTHKYRVYGLPKVIYCIIAEREKDTKYFVSSKECKINTGYVIAYDFLNLETQDCAQLAPCIDMGFDDSTWEYASETEPLNTEYCKTNCPSDALIAELSLKPVGQGKYGVIYDCGQNTTGYPILKLTENSKEVRVLFSEELGLDNTLDMEHSHQQEFVVCSDGVERIVQPEFTWYGFRYFEIIGNASPLCVKVIHADIDVTSEFDCDDPTLNWIYKTFIHTMLCNMHIGHPCDCPHIERLGYTGDGQLTCHSALSVLDGKAFYEKWLQDIADGQDTKTGHVQYTAPYVRSGGGPGGWGCAIVEVPYRLYKCFGDKEILSKYYGNMRRYIDYLEAHSEFNLVTSDKEGGWCLGDWCGPNILYPNKKITSSHAQQILIPAPMVNTYFMAKSLMRMSEIAKIIGRDDDICEYENKANICKRAIQAAYLNTFDGNFVLNAQGANAFAVDLGLGNEKTYPNLVDYYQQIGGFDTGIFATDVLLRVLFENGNGELAVDLLTKDSEKGFVKWLKNGATTFHEYWDSNDSRSHNHHMFGSPVAYFFEYLLGIQQERYTGGYSSLIIQPQAVKKFNRLSGKLKTPNGYVEVCYKKENGKIYFDIQIPENIKALFKYSNKEYILKNSANTFCFDL